MFKARFSDVGGKAPFQFRCPPPLTPLTLTLATNIRKPALNYMLLMPAELIVDDDYIAAMLRYNVKPGRTRASTRAFINDTTAGFIPPLQVTRGEDICFRALPVGAQLFRLSGTCSVACSRDLKVVPAGAVGYRAEVKREGGVSRATVFASVQSGQLIVSRNVRGARRLLLSDGEVLVQHSIHDEEYHVRDEDHEEEHEGTVCNARSVPG